MQAMKHSSKGVYSGFETKSRHHQKSKTGVISGSTKWTDVLQNILQMDENWQCSPNLDLNPTYVEMVGKHYEKNYTMGSLLAKDSKFTLQLSIASF